jgi:hypothetical protein
MRPRMIYKHQTKHGSGCSRTARVGSHPKPAAFKAWTKTACILFIGVLISGCCVTAGTDGNIRVISCRLLWKSEDISFSVRSTNLNARLSIGKTTTDANAVGAVTEGAVKALTRP